MTRTSLAAKVAPSSVLECIFRVGVAGCFIGHGAFGLLGKQAWLPYFAVVGIPEHWAVSLMPWVGAVDILAGVLTLFVPLPAVLVYMFGWAAWTALLRPLAGESLFETVERAGNFGLPLAFLVATGFQASKAGVRDWVTRVRVDLGDANRRARVVRVLQATTALLLIGHGALAALGKPLLQQHIQLVTAQVELLPLIGAFEIALGTAIWLSAHPGLLVTALLWKVGTEALFLLGGAPVWEFVERAGSYAAPLGVLILTGAHAAVSGAGRRRVIRTATAVTMVVGTLGTAVTLMAAPTPARVGVLAELRKGDLVLACRHSITDRSRGDARRVRLNDPSTQRVLSEAGREQARRLGQVLESLRVPIAEVHASPYARTADTAELAFGRVARTETLQYGNSSEQKRGREDFLATAPRDGNRVLISHQGILYGMLPDVPRGSIREGDCVVTTAGSPGDRVVLGRFGPEEFATLSE